VMKDCPANHPFCASRSSVNPEYAIEFGGC
jgi:hypothetical protein